jgi:hypothetical protein
MLAIFENEKMNKIANEYFLMFFDRVDDSIELDGYKSAFMEIFPEHLVREEKKKCKKIYNELHSWILDEFLHDALRPIHEYVLYNMLEFQAEIESENERSGDGQAEVDEEIELLMLFLPEEEKEYLRNIDNASFYLDFFFEDLDFLDYKTFYDSFGTETFDEMRYDLRIIELLPKDKRKELEDKTRN